MREPGVMMIMKRFINHRVKWANNTTYTWTEVVISLVVQTASYCFCASQSWFRLHHPLMTEKLRLRSVVSC